MISESKKNIKIIKNKTKKRRQKIVNSIDSLTPEERSIVCKTSHNTYNTFEDKIDKIFKEKNLDIISTSYNLEKEIVSDLKKAVNVKLNYTFVMHFRINFKLFDLTIL